MIEYMLITVGIVFSIIAGLIILALSSRTGGIKTSPSPQGGEDSAKEWKWSSRIWWGIFTLTVFHLWWKFIFSSVPIEWREWLPGFSWNMVEIIIVSIGLFLLWNKKKKKENMENGGLMNSGAHRSHLSPAEITGQFYAGVPQVKWIRTTGESFWIGASIFMVGCFIFGGLMYMSGGMDILLKFLEKAVSPTPLSRGVVVLLIFSGIYPFMGDARVIALWLSILSIVFGCVLYGWGWFSVYPSMGGVSIPTPFLVVPMIFISLQALWKSFWSDWFTPAFFLLIWFFFVGFIQSSAIS